MCTVIKHFAFVVMVSILHGLIHNLHTLEHLHGKTLRRNIVLLAFHFEKITLQLSLHESINQSHFLAV